MIIGGMKKKQEYLMTPLEVDTWKTNHNKEDEIIDTFIGKTKMQEVEEILLVL